MPSRSEHKPAFERRRPKGVVVRALPRNDHPWTSYRGSSERVLERFDAIIQHEDHIYLVGTKVRTLSLSCGLDNVAIAAVSTATFELARNALVHAGRGVATVEKVTDGERLGIRVTISDRGPGIADLDRVMRGGFSTTNSLGLGVSGSRRLIEDEFIIDSALGCGTTVTFAKWTPPSDP
jgi:serine/threonine-protein kinase RsbT